MLEEVAEECRAKGAPEVGFSKSHKPKTTNF